MPTSLVPSTDTGGGVWDVPLVAVTLAAYFEVGVPPAPGEPSPIDGADIAGDLFGEAVDFDNERVEEVIERLLTLVAPPIRKALEDAAAGDETPGPAPNALPERDPTVQSDGAGVVVDVFAT